MATQTTPIYGFPYPDGNEKVRDGDDAMGALASAIETEMANPLSCVATGTVMVGITGAERLLTLRNFSSGFNMIDGTNDRLLIPAGGGGIYRAVAAISCQNMASALGNFARARFVVNGGTQAEGVTLFATGGGVGWMTLTGIYSLGAASTIGVNVLPHATVAADIGLLRLSIVRVGNAYGATP